jgi:hypothetical protein
MSSVTRFIRQIPLATTYYNAQEIVASPSTTVFEFAPSSSNYVGNYPSPYPNQTGGYMIAASAALQAAIAQAAAANSAGAGLVLRDMGKTIFAPTTNSATASWGYFRQVQLLAPGLITQGPGFMGGLSGNTFGVLGAAGTPDVYTNYLVFYIPVSVAGVSGAPGVDTKAYAIAGGQM